MAYDGEDYEAVYARADVREAYSPTEFEEKVKQLVVDGLSNPIAQGEYRRFGATSAVVRYFEDVVLVHFPVGEFTGVGLTFDREPAPGVDELVAVGERHLVEIAGQ